MLLSASKIAGNEYTFRIHTFQIYFFFSWVYEFISKSLCYFCDKQFKKLAPVLILVLSLLIRLTLLLGLKFFFFFKLSTPRLVPTLMFTIEITNLDSG